MIFLDRSLPKSVAQALKAVRDDIVWLEDIFDHSTPDATWLRAVGINGWLVVSRDRKIRTRLAERREIIENQVGFFCLIQKQNLSRWECLKLLAATLDEMEAVFARTERPFIYGVYRDGTLRPLYLKPLNPPLQDA